MFVTVRYGEDRSKIFNADCKNENLLENIKLQCGCGMKEMVEVSDERGVVKNLRNFPTEYGSDFLKEREILVLLTVQNGTTETDDNQSDRPFFTPLLASLRNDRDFNDTLNQDSDIEVVDGNITNGKRQQLASETDDDVLNKSMKGKLKGSNTTTASTPPKKSILRKATKSSLRK